MTTAIRPGTRVRRLVANAHECPGAGCCSVTQPPGEATVEDLHPWNEEFALVRLSCGRLIWLPLDRLMTRDQRDAQGGRRIA
jgi:hypothetical protein